MAICSIKNGCTAAIIKHIFHIVAIAAVMVSCSKGPVDIHPDRQEASPIYATFAHNGATKVGLGSSDGVNTPLAWHQGDEIVVRNCQSETAGIYRTASAVSDGDADARFFYETQDGTFPAAEQESHIAVYPRSKVNLSDGSFTYAAEQTYEEGSIDRLALPMVATNDKGFNFTFSAQAAVLRLKVSTPESGVKVNSIVLSSQSKNLTGNSSLGGTMQYGPPATDTGKVVTLDCGEGVSIGKTPKEFCIVVPAQEYPAGDLSVTVYTDGGEIAKTSKAGASFEAGKVYNIHIGDEALSTEFLSASETVAAMGAGWNLGNTLDSHSGDTTNMWLEGYGTGDISQYVTAWGQVTPTKELFKMMREAGFRAVRVPVTWYPHMGTNFNIQMVNGQPLWQPSLYPVGNTVDADWMAEVKRVVDAVLEADMYCIINVHHDTGTSNTHWLVASSENYEQSNGRFKTLWTQIAETFKDYDGRLLFEGFNEMTDAADSWCFASFGTPSGYDAEMATDAYKTINAYNQDFVDAVRATGGNNAERNLVLNTYAACCGDGEWNEHIQDPLTQMERPTDSATDHIIFQVHYYPGFSNLTEAKSNVDNMLSGLTANLTSKGAPVILGEWGVGAGSTVTYDTDRETYLAFAEYLVKKAKESNIGTFYWMGISDGAGRSVPKFTQPDLKDAIIRGMGEPD